MDLLDQLMFAGDLPAFKPRYHLVNGEWLPKTEPANPPVVEVVPKDWSTCSAPKVGKPCPTCNGNQVYVFQDGREEVCHWCTHGRGIISPRDKRNFDRRVMQKLPISFIVTRAASSSI